MGFAYSPGTKGVPNPSKPGIFLGGSIEMGAAEDWQARATKEFNLDTVNVFNPRRLNWDTSLVQSIEDPDFVYQVEWELGHIQGADCVIMNFEPNTKSPISLLELGLVAGANGQGALNKMIVRCPEGFWRKGNVDIVARQYRIPIVNDWDELFSEANTLMLRNWQRRTEPKSIW